jgi:hypothetical protein
METRAGVGVRTALPAGSASDADSARQCLHESSIAFAIQLCRDRLAAATLDYVKRGDARSVEGRLQDRGDHYEEEWECRVTDNVADDIRRVTDLPRPA